MNSSNIIAIAAALISIAAFLQNRAAYKQTVIINLENRLAEMANRCNSYIEPISQSHPINTQEVSAVLTTILNAKRHLKLAYKSHGHILRSCDSEDFIEFFSTILHSSIIELIKNSLPNSVDDLARRPKIQEQHEKCKVFLQKLLN